MYVEHSYYRLGRKGKLGMRKVLLTSMGLAGLLADSLVQGTAAAPVVFDDPSIAPDSGSLEQVYYYHGRYYRYYYHHRYYVHRAYRLGHWHYY
jgi:hypothetical protein